MVIRAQGVTKVYTLGATEVPALREADLDVERGEMLALMGPSGSGKTTFMNILGCLDVPTSGSYTLNGREVARLNDNELAEVRSREVGFVFQTFNLLADATAQRNVELAMVYAGVGRGERRRRARELLDQVGLGPRVEHRPAELSGGERQRVAIARSLANRPSLILADEPTGNLDTASGQEILRVFRDLHAAGHTILLVTHNPDVAALAPRCVRLRDGRIESDARA